MGNFKNPHDRLFKEALGNTETAKDLLVNYLPAPLLQLIDLNQLTLEKDTFIEASLREYFSDLLIKTALSGRPGYLSA